MVMSKRYIFILWADQFEEAVATIFLTEFRRAGLSVKFVGLSHPWTKGAYGLILVPDLTLEQALPLASKVICTVIPCKSSRLKHLQADPRMQNFLMEGQANQAIFIFEQKLIGLNQLPISLENVITYPENEVLVEFARSLAQQIRLLQTQRFKGAFPEPNHERGSSGKNLE